MDANAHNQIATLEAKFSESKLVAKILHEKCCDLEDQLAAKDLRSDSQVAMEASDHASEVTAQLLANIARTGIHKGAFASPIIEAAAQTILAMALRLRAAEIIRGSV